MNNKEYGEYIKSLTPRINRADFTRVISGFRGHKGFYIYGDIIAKVMVGKVMIYRA